MNCFKYTSNTMVIDISKKGFYPDCAAYFSRIDDSGVTQTQTVYIDPTIAPTFNTDYVDDTGINGVRFYARFYINGKLGNSGYSVSHKFC